MIVLITRGDAITIPDTAIRFRVVANSNSTDDQTIKLRVKENLEKDLYSYLKDVKSINDAKKQLNQNLDNINKNVENTLLKNNYNDNFNVHLGLNHFPSKEFKGVVYDEGDYESLVVTLGSGMGDNWWCVLFPPLCLLEAEEENIDEIEYQFFVKKLLNKYLK